jgi:hypothetical protein
LPVVSIDTAGLSCQAYSLTTERIYCMRSVKPDVTWSGNRNVTAGWPRPLPAVRRGGYDIVAVHISDQPV